MKTDVEVVGVYPVQNNQDVHLIEIKIKDSTQKFDIFQFTQEISSQPREYWQVPWNEKLLNEAGTEIIANDFLLTKESKLWIGNLRLIFFFHHLDFSKPLMTPFGFVNLPKESIKPNRLSRIAYESPD